MNLLKIKKIAEDKKISITHIAGEISMTPQNLHRCVRDNKIDAFTLYKVSKVLDVPISTFFEEKQSAITNNQVHHGTGDNNIVSAQAHEIELLKDLVAEKERTIQILLDKK